MEPNSVEINQMETYSTPVSSLFVKFQSWIELRLWLPQNYFK